MLVVRLFLAACHSFTECQYPVPTYRVLCIAGFLDTWNYTCRILRQQTFKLIIGADTVAKSNNQVPVLNALMFYIVNLLNLMVYYVKIILAAATTG